MGMFAAAGYTDNRFCLEGNVEAVFSEYFTDNDAGFQFIIAGLERIHGESPVQFQLFADIYRMAGIVHLRFDAPYFFMAHFYTHAPGIEFFNGLFHGGPYVAPHSLPVLFLESLGNGKMLYRFCFTRRLDPEFQFRADGKSDIRNVVKRYIFHAFYSLAAGQEALQFTCYVSAGIFQNGTGINEFAIVQQEAGNTQGSYGAAIVIDVVFIVVDIPVYAGISHHINPGIIQGSDVHENNGRTIGLHSGAGKEIIVVFQEQLNRHFFIGIVAGQVDAYQGYETNFRMGLQKGKYSFFAKFTGWNVIQ